VALKRIFWLDSCHKYLQCMCCQINHSS